MGDLTDSIGCVFGCYTAAFLAAGLIIGGGIWGTSRHFAKRNLPQIEQKDLNNDGKLDWKIERRGKLPEYLISNPKGNYDHGRLVVDNGIGFIKLDNGDFYSFGEKGLEKLTIPK